MLIQCSLTFRDETWFQRKVLTNKLKLTLTHRHTQENRTNNQMITLSGGIFRASAKPSLILSLKVAKVVLPAMHVSPRIGQKLIDGTDVLLVGLWVLRVVLDKRHVLIGLRAKSHARILRQDGIIADQTRPDIVGEAVQKDREHPFEWRLRSALVIAS